MCKEECAQIAKEEKMPSQGLASPSSPHQQSRVCFPAEWLHAPAHRWTQFTQESRKKPSFLLWLCSSLTFVLCLQVEGGCSPVPGWGTGQPGEDSPSRGNCKEKVPTKWLHSSGGRTAELFNVISVGLQEDQHTSPKVLPSFICFPSRLAVSSKACELRALSWHLHQLRWSNCHPALVWELPTAWYPCQRTPAPTQANPWDAELWSATRHWWVPLSKSPANNVQLMRTLVGRRAGGEECGIPLWGYWVWKPVSINYE